MDNEGGEYFVYMNIYKAFKRCSEFAEKKVTIRLYFTTVYADSGHVLTGFYTERYTRKINVWNMATLNKNGNKIENVES